MTLTVCLFYLVVLKVAASFVTAFLMGVAKTPPILAIKPRMGVHKCAWIVSTCVLTCRRGGGILACVCACVSSFSSLLVPHGIYFFTR